MLLKKNMKYADNLLAVDKDWQADDFLEDGTFSSLSNVHHKSTYNKLLELCPPMFGKLSDRDRAKNRRCEKSTFFLGQNGHDYMVVFNAPVR